MNKVKPQVFRERVKFVQQFYDVYSRHKICNLLGISKNDLWRYEEAAGVKIPKRKTGRFYEVDYETREAEEKAKAEEVHRKFLANLKNFKWSKNIERSLAPRLFKMLERKGG